MKAAITASSTEYLTAVLDACRPIWETIPEQDRKTLSWTNPIVREMGRAGAAAIAPESISDKCRAIRFLESAGNFAQEFTFESCALDFTAYTMEEDLRTTEANDAPDALSRTCFLKREISDGATPDTNNLVEYLASIHSDWMKFAMPDFAAAAD